MIKYSQKIFNYNKFKTLFGKLNLEDLVRDIDFSYITCPRRVYKAQTKKAMAIKVFLTFMKIVIKDIVKTGNVFRLPTYKKAFLFVGDDWDDRESHAMIQENIFSFDNKKVMQISINKKGLIINKMCIVQKDLFKEINDNKNRYILDPTMSL
jgi:hypothetical protein